MTPGWGSGGPAGDYYLGILTFVACFASLNAYFGTMRAKKRRRSCVVAPTTRPRRFYHQGADSDVRPAVRVSRTSRRFVSSGRDRTLTVQSCRRPQCRRSPPLLGPYRAQNGAARDPQQRERGLARRDRVVRRKGKARRARHGAARRAASGCFGQQRPWTELRAAPRCS